MYLIRLKFLVVGALLGMVGCASETSSGGSPLGGTDPSASPATDTQDATPSGGAAGMGAAAPAATTGDVDTGSDAASTGDAPDDAAPADTATSDDTAADDSTPEDNTDNADDPAPQTRRPPCLKDPSQVILIGDSYINWVSHTFPGDLFAEAGQTFRNYAVGGYAMGSGGIGFIPPQLDQAIAEDADITTVVMTGGGNDILVPDTLQYPRGGDCKMTEMAPMIDDCRAIVDRALEAADEMMTGGIAELGDDATTDVIYFFYPNVPNGTVVGGLYPNAILDYAAPLVQDFCESSFERSEGKVDCHFVDLRPVFEGHPEYFAPTDIHPSTAGSAAMAEAVWQTMVDACIAQPESSGCCEP